MFNRVPTVTLLGVPRSSRQKIKEKNEARSKGPRLNNARSAPTLRVVCLSSLATREKALMRPSSSHKRCRQRRRLLTEKKPSLCSTICIIGMSRMLVSPLASQIHERRQDGTAIPEARADGVVAEAYVNRAHGQQGAAPEPCHVPFKTGAPEGGGRRWSLPCRHPEVSLRAVMKRAGGVAQPSSAPPAPQRQQQLLPHTRPPATGGSSYIRTLLFPFPSHDPNKIHTRTFCFPISDNDPSKIHIAKLLVGLQGSNARGLCPQSTGASSASASQSASRDGTGPEHCCIPPYESVLSMS